MPPSVRQCICLSDGVNICACSFGTALGWSIDHIDYVYVVYMIYGWSEWVEINIRDMFSYFQDTILAAVGPVYILSRLILVESIVAQIHESTRWPWPMPNGSQLSLCTSILVVVDKQSRQGR